MLVLTVAKGPDRGKVFELRDVSRVIIGRNSPDLKLNDIMISRYHAKLKRDGDRWLLRDLGSRNGTKLNGERLAQVAILKTGDHIVTGYTEFEVSFVPDPSDAPTLETAASPTEEKLDIEELEIEVQGAASSSPIDALSSDDPFELDEPQTPASRSDEEAPVSAGSIRQLTDDPVEERQVQDGAADNRALEEVAAEKDHSVLAPIVSPITDDIADADEDVEVEVESEVKAVAAHEAGDSEHAAQVEVHDEATKPATDGPVSEVMEVLAGEPTADLKGAPESELSQLMRELTGSSESPAAAATISAQEEKVVTSSFAATAEPESAESGMLNLGPITDSMLSDAQSSPLSAEQNHGAKAAPLTERAASEWMSAIESQLVIAEGQGWEDVADEEDDGFLGAVSDEVEPLADHERSLLYFDEDDHWADDVQPDDDEMVSALEEDGPDALLRDLQIKPAGSLAEKPSISPAKAGGKGNKTKRR